MNLDGIITAANEDGEGMGKRLRVQVVGVLGVLLFCGGAANSQSLKFKWKQDLPEKISW